MREIVFLRKHADKWKHFEEVLENPSSVHPDKLAELYVELTNDLAYAQSQYPGSKTTKYLNQLSLKVHDSLYKNRKEQSSRLITFWTQEIPSLYAEKQKEVLYSFIVFTIAFAIGFISSHQEPDFVRLILGDQYVNMTLSNIEQNDPLAVYKDERELTMFFGITLNNVQVSFYAFVLGLITSVGPAYLLINNGIMLGSFLEFFNRFNLLEKSLLVVFIHGTLEISAIILAGAAGFVFGNSFLFPGTHSRIRSFVTGAKEGLKMVIGLVPIFIMAGLLESFVTRYTEMPVWVSLLIILSSLAFILYYFIILPWIINLKNKNYG